MLPMFDVRGRVIAVAGAAGAFGSVISESLVELGCKVAVYDKESDRLHDLVGRIASDELYHRAFDATDENACISALEGVQDNWGRLDGFVNCVGLFEIHPASEMPEQVFSDVVDANLNAAFLLSRTAAKLMIPQKSGRIVNIASVSDSISNPGYAAYASSKAALTHLTKVLAVEWAQYSITVNAISPAICDTPLTHSFLEKGDNRENARSRIPMGRLLEPSDILGTVILLLSDAGSFITGQAIHVDGGRTIS